MRMRNEDEDNVDNVVLEIVDENEDEDNVDNECG